LLFDAFSLSLKINKNYTKCEQFIRIKYNTEEFTKIITYKFPSQVLN